MPLDLFYLKFPRNLMLISFLLFDKISWKNAECKSKLLSETQFVDCISFRILREIPLTRVSNEQQRTSVEWFPVNSDELNVVRERGRRDKERRGKIEREKERNGVETGKFSRFTQFNFKLPASFVHRNKVLELFSIFLFANLFCEFQFSAIFKIFIDIYTHRFLQKLF